MQIYRITNLITGLSYIGKDQNDNQYYMGSGILLWNSYRKRFHRKDLDSKKRTDHKWVYNENLIQQYYKKEILHVCDNADELCELEKYYIHKYNTIKPHGYNIANGGAGGNLVSGYTEEERAALNLLISERTKEAMKRNDVREKFMSAVQNKSEEWKINISKALIGRKGKPLSKEQIELLRAINMGNQYGIGNKSRTGYTNSDEMNKHISESLKNVVHTQEWNENVSKALKGVPKSEEHKQALRKPKPKYKWQLPDGSIKIMDASNGSRHKGWIRLQKVS